MNGAFRMVMPVPPFPQAIEVSKGQSAWLQKEISYIKMFLNAVYFILNFLGCM